MSNSFFHLLATVMWKFIMSTPEGCHMLSEFIKFTYQFNLPLLSFFSFMADYQETKQITLVNYWYVYWLFITVGHERAGRKWVILPLPPSSELCMSDELAERNASGSASAAVISSHHSFTSSAVAHTHIHTNECFPPPLLSVILIRQLEIQGGDITLNKQHPYKFT